MLELRELSVHESARAHPRTLVHDLSTTLPPGHFCGVIGPVWAGKTALIEALAGARPSHSGSILWNTHPLEPRRAGLAKSDADGFDRGLTVCRRIELAIAVRVGGLVESDRRERARGIIEDTGLDDAAHRPISALDPAGRRRLRCALALAGAPALLLCDDLAKDLPPLEEQAIVTMQKELAMKRHLLVISATRTLRHLAQYDSLLVLYNGMIAYHGPYEFLLHYFRVTQAEDLFPMLATRDAADWYRSWLKHREPYVEPVMAITSHSESEASRIAELFAGFRKPGTLAKESTRIVDLSLSAGRPPAPRAQTGALLLWRCEALGANPVAALERIGLALAGPIAVSAWARHYGAGEPAQWLIALIIVFGVMNGAREIAGRRELWRGEHRTGVPANALLFSTFAFAGVQVLAQAVWTTVIAHAFGFFPAGGMALHIVLFAFAGAAMTALCLAVSAFSSTPERALLGSFGVAAAQCVFLASTLPAALAYFALPPWTGHALHDPGVSLVSLLVLSLQCGAGLACAALGLHRVLKRLP
jgi:ABC-type multidrug transport system ATPase subunit